MRDVVNIRWGRGNASSSVRCVAALLTSFVVVLFVPALPAGAHGVDVTAELVDPADETGVIAGEVLVGFTDETGETCVEVVASSGTFSLSIHRVAEPLASLISFDGVAGGEETCQLADVDVVNEVLADIDANAITVVGDGELVGTGVLTKPKPPGFESTEPRSSAADQPDESAGAETAGSSTQNSRLLVAAVLLGPLAIAIVGLVAVKRVAARRESRDLPA